MKIGTTENSDKSGENQKTQKNVQTLAQWAQIKEQDDIEGFLSFGGQNVHTKYYLQG